MARLQTSGGAVTYSKTILCLANSWKMSGRCVAGRELTHAGFGTWVRPISDRADEELSHHDRAYENGQDVQVLDVVTVALLQGRPHAHQTENHIIDASTYWRCERRASWQELQAALQTPATLWTNQSSSFNGIHDRVPESTLAGLGGSLVLIRPTSLVVSVAPEGAGQQKRKVRASFSYNSHSYRIAVTDPIAMKTFLDQADGEHAVGEAVLCVSLGEAFNGYAYKLAAAVITPNRSEHQP